jgi:Response regulator containing a CheY-like receiver domain and an HTH DNA-binding domain
MGIRNKSVLLVDDNSYIRKALRAMFEAAGFVCTESGSGAQGIEEAARLKPDLIVLDFSMPAMNGLEATPLFKEKLPLTPIIMFTMFATEAFSKAAVEAGVTEVVSKERAADLILRAESLLNTGFEGETATAVA